MGFLTCAIFAEGQFKKGWGLLQEGDSECHLLASISQNLDLWFEETNIRGLKQLLPPLIASGDGIGKSRHGVPVPRRSTVIPDNRLTEGSFLAILARRTRRASFLLFFGSTAI